MTEHVAVAIDALLGWSRIQTRYQLRPDGGIECLSRRTDWRRSRRGEWRVEQGAWEPSGVVLYYGEPSTMRAWLGCRTVLASLLRRAASALDPEGC